MRASSLTSLNLPTPILRAVRRIAEQVRDAGGRAWLVGGCVRDAFMGLASEEADLEVFGIAADDLEALLRKDFPIETVGRSFGVFIVKGLALDISIPRRESKQSPGHRGFRVEGAPDLDPKEAASRRDFTINAISWDPLTGDMMDPWNGRSDLETGVLRHVSTPFSEDPLRVLRAMQFSARFDFPVAPETVALCATMEPEGLPRERLFDEWKKLLVRGRKPSRGLRFLQDCGWIRYYPELERLIDCPQDPRWHPEGSVWNHTLHCLDAFATHRTGDEREDLTVGLAVLLHDVGKPATTVIENDAIRSPGHDTLGVEPARNFLERLTAHRDLIEDVLVLIETHMRPAALYQANASDSAIRRLARKVQRIDRLVRVCEADAAGRPPLDSEYPAGAWLLQRAEALQVQDSAPRRILQGRHLIARGMKPGPAFGPLLEEAYEAQLNGAFHDEEGALRYLEENKREEEVIHE